MGKFSKKLLTAAVVTLLAGPTYAVEQSKECNSTDSLDGWGIWCGIDTFLSQQEPTAAGPGGGDSPGLGGVTFDSSQFGGDVVIPEDQYNWQGFALFLNVNDRSSVLGRLFFDVDEDNELLRNIRVVLDDGTTVNIPTEDFYPAAYFDPGNAQIIIGEGTNQYVLAGLTNRLLSEGSFNEDGLYMGGVGIINFNPDDAEMPTEVDSLLSRLNSITIGTAGSPTPLETMSNLNSIEATAKFSLLGVSHTSGSFNNAGYLTGRMRVNFGEGEWNAHLASKKLVGDGPRRIGLSSGGQVEGNEFSSEFVKTRLRHRHLNVDGETSYMNGIFLGPNANALTGQVNVSVVPHTSDNGGYEGPDKVKPTGPEFNLKGTFVGQQDRMKVPDLERE